MIKFNLEMITDKEDIPFITVIERFKTNKLDLDVLRTSIKKSDTKVRRYLNQYGSISLYRHFIDLFNKYRASGAVIESIVDNLFIAKKSKWKIPNLNNIFSDAYSAHYIPLVATDDGSTPLEATIDDGDHEYDEDCDCDDCLEYYEEHIAENLDSDEIDF